MDLNSDDYYGSAGLENVSNTVCSFIFPVNSSPFVTRQLNGKGAGGVGVGVTANVTAWTQKQMK